MHFDGGERVASVNVTFRLDSDVKQQFDIFCDNTGMTVTSALTMFIKATLRQRELPFKVTDVNTFPVNVTSSVPGT